MLYEEYTRISENYQKCLKAFDDIVVFCTAQHNYTIAGIIEDCLSSLTPPPSSSIDNQFKDISHD